MWGAGVQTRGVYISARYGGEGAVQVQDEMSVPRRCGYVGVQARRGRSDVYENERMYLCSCRVVSKKDDNSGNFCDRVGSEQSKKALVSERARRRG